MRLGICLGVACAVILSSGCSQLEVSNPFATVSDIKETYASQFTDIPVPTEMKSVPSSTLTTPTQQGIKVGLETYEGRVDSASLANAMIHNMARQGWSLRGSVTGKRTMQLHEKDQRFGVIYINGGTITTTMEVWVLNRLSGSGHVNAALGAAPISTTPTTSGSVSSGSGAGSGSGTGTTGSSTYSPAPASSASEQWEGGKPLSN